MTALSIWRTLLPFVAIAVAPPAFAWDGNGHRMACVKAWSELDEPARTAVSRILDVRSGDEFAATCAWADEILEDRPDTSAWHAVLIPKDARSIDLARDCANRCVVREIERQAEILAAPSSPAAQAEALKFLAHFVADVHQPLNVAFAEDRGGRDIAVSFLGRASNMHELWASLLLAAPDPPSRGYTPFLQEMNDRYNRERWANGTPLAWADETLWIMRAPPTGYLGNPGGLEFDALFVSQNYLVALDQLEKSGLRLAFLLNGIFK